VIHVGHDSPSLGYRSKILKFEKFERFKRFKRFEKFKKFKKLERLERAERLKEKGPLQQFLKSLKFPNPPLIS
jgi:hypothetical protein